MYKRDRALSTHIVSVSGISKSKRRKRRRIIALAILLILLIVAGNFGLSLAAAFRDNPGEDNFLVVAEWARDRGFGPVVTAAEYVQYQLNPPIVGGTPDLKVLQSAVSTSRNSSLHAPLSTVVSPALSGEGMFRAVGGTGSRGDLQITYMRPDKVHTSYLTGIAWMSHNDRFVLHPGYSDPGQLNLWSQTDKVLSTDSANLLATFNGGFKMKDANGGYYDHGHQTGNLTPGAASLVIYKDGHATVGTWGADVSMTPDVAFVRQNLKPLIANGVTASDLNANVQSNWGATVGGDLAVWRSGLGVTASGDLVYVMGDALTVNALANLLHNAGSVNAMQLDINRSWISFMYYRHHGQAPTPHKMGNFQDPAGRYLQPTNRDFVAVYAPAPASQQHS